MWEDKPMKRSILSVVTLAALLAASTATARSAFAGTDGTAASAFGGALALPVFEMSAGEDAGDASLFAAREGISHRSIRRRPRDRWRDRDRGYGRYGGFSQIHGGFYDPEDESSTGALFGFRGGTDVDEHIQLGVGFDWSHRSDRSTAVISEEPLPGGGTTVRRLELARSSSDLLPFMAFIQFAPGGRGGVQPYFGLGGGYEVLFVSAEDFASGLDYDATFGGWGWQAWGGLSVPLSGRSSVNVEVYSNQAEVARDVEDPIGGYEVRELVNVDGVGMRFGLRWGF